MSLVDVSEEAEVSLKRRSYSHFINAFFSQEFSQSDDIERAAESVIRPRHFEEICAIHLVSAQQARQKKVLALGTHLKSLCKSASMYMLIRF